MSSGFESYEDILASVDAGNKVQVLEDLWLRLGDSMDHLTTRYIAENASGMMMFGVNDASELSEVDDGAMIGQ